MKKILMVSLGRINSYTYEMAKIVSAYSPESSVIISRFALERGEKWFELGFKNTIVLDTYKSTRNVIPATIRFLLRDLKRIKKLAKEEQFDIIYAPQSFYLWLMPIVLACKVPRFITTIHDPNPHSGAKILASMVDTWVPKVADDIIILSESFRNTIIKRYKKDSNHVFANPCGLYDLYEDSVPLDGINYSDKSTNFLFFGRIEKYKGIEVLLDAYSKIEEKYNVSLSIVGNGDIAQYQAKIQQLKHVSIVNRYINDNEVKHCFTGPNIILVIPYMDATQSGPVVIAQRYNVPIIGTNTGAIPEQLQYGRGGILCMPGSVDSLMEAMVFALENPDEIRRILKWNTKRCESIQWKKIGERLIDVFEKQIS